MPTELTKLLGMRLPVLQAPMAGSQDHRLAVAVAQAGGLGAIPGAMLTPEALDRELSAFRQATPAPVNVNFFCHTPPQPNDTAQAQWLQALAPFHREFGIDPATLASGPGRVPFNADTADVLARHRPAVVSFHFGLPNADLLARVKAWGAQVLCSATTVDEGLWLQAQGADAVIAQGLEAGGHRGHFLSNDLTRQTGTLALVPQLAAALQVPVIAAGGIATPAAVAAARALGASAVQVGTAYLLCPEATTSAVHRAALQSDQAPHSAHPPVHRAPGTGHRQPADARTGPPAPRCTGLPFGHRRRGTAEGGRRSARLRRFFAPVGRPVGPAVPPTNRCGPHAVAGQRLGRGALTTHPPDRQMSKAIILGFAGNTPSA